MKLTWTEFKQVVSNNSLRIQYIDKNKFYHLYTADDTVNYTCDISKAPTAPGGSDQEDFENNYKDDANGGLSPKDSDGSPIARTKMTKSGWHYQLYGLEMQTAKLNSLVDKDVDGSSLSNSTIKFYDNNDTELTTQAELDSSCVKTVIDWEPPWDYEIIGGTFRQLNVPASDTVMHVIAVPDIPAGSGGSIPFVNNINLRFVGTEDRIEANGRTSKHLTYSASLHTNKLRIIVEHNVSVQHRMQIQFEIFRA